MNIRTLHSKLLIIILIISSCSTKQENKHTYLSVKGFTQGTNYMVKYSSPDTVNYKKQIEAVLADIDTSMSTYNKQSVISRINNNEDKVKVDEYFKEVFEAAMKVSEKTDGAFDITVGPLVNAWGFGQEKIREIDSVVVDSIKQFVGYKKVKLKNGRIYKEDKRLKLNMNAIAQGYTVDVLSDFLDDKGVRNYLVEVGGEVRTKGISPSGRKWRIGIDKPVDSNYVAGQNLQAIVEIQNRGLATSGNYRNFYIEDGVKYAHTIDPKSGYPVTHKLLSASVFAPDCVTADAYATAFMVMGMKRSKELVESLKEIDAYFIYSDHQGNFKVDYSKNLKGSITSVE
jgi:thiamine biosynthesis lipoprotein